MTKRLGRFFEKHIPEIASSFERILEVNISPVRIVPLKIFHEEGIEDMANYSWAKKNVVAQAWPGSIAYSKNSLLLLPYGQKEMQFIAAHEVAHLVHIDLVPSAFTIGEQEHVTEGFANYAARRILEEEGIPFTEPPEAIVRRVAFEAALSRNGAETWSEVANYLRSR